MEVRRRRTPSDREGHDSRPVRAALPPAPRRRPERSIPTWTGSIATSAQLYAKVVRAFADAGCRYLQLDEVNLAYLCDAKCASMRGRGDDPDTLAKLTAT